MSKPEWGTKRICQACGVRYYDLNKAAPVCPKCATTYDFEALLRARRGKAAEKARKPAEDDLPLVDQVDVEVTEGEAPLIEDAEELGDDAVEEVVVEEGDTER